MTPVFILMMIAMAWTAMGSAQEKPAETMQFVIEKSERTNNCLWQKIWG